jgi:hypothetical protein
LRRTFHPQQERIMRRVTVVSLWLALASVVPSRARAWCPDKYPGQTNNAAWTTLPVKYRVSSNLTDAATLAAIDAAFTTWGTVQCSKLAFMKDAAFPITTPFTTGTGHISIFWVTAQANWPAGVDVKNFAYNYRFFDAQHNLTGGHIAINATGNYAWNTTGGNSSTFDVQNVLTNLIGHVIGLTDSNTAGSVMFDDVAFGQITKRTLSADDQDAIKYTYPAAGCPAAPGPDSTCGTTPPPPKDSGPPATDGQVTPGKDSSATPGKDSSVTPGKDGAPAKKCTSSTQCASDEVCVTEGYCLKKSGGGGGGCGCQIGVRGVPALGLALLALGALLIKACTSWRCSRAASRTRWRSPTPSARRGRCNPGGWCRSPSARRRCRDRARRRSSR